MLRKILPFLCLLACAVAAQAENPRPYGLNVHAPSGAELDRVLDAAHAAGLGWVRVDFIWAWIEPQQNHFEWGVYDAIVDAAAVRGLSVLAILAYSPTWATDGPELSGPPRNADDWRDFCAHVAARYRGRVDRFELWNEPNQHAFWTGTRQQYIDLVLKPGSEAIHASAPASKVGGPALAHLVAGDSDWYRWLDDVLGQASPQLDFVTHHVYDADIANLTRKLTGSTHFANQPSLWDVENPSLREVLKRAGWYPSRPVWLTETGWSSQPPAGESVQAAHAESFLTSWFSGKSGQGWLEKAFIYDAEDSAGSGAFGLLRDDGSPKPAYDAVKDFVAAHEGLPEGPPPDGELALLGQRFRVTVRWRTSDGTTGFGHASTLTDQSGEFWFFGPGNIELVVKTLDGRGLNHRFWFFYGALSDVEYWITVKDSVTGASNEYHNPAGRICGQADTAAFVPLPAPPASSDLAMLSPAASLPAVGGFAACTSDARTLCLQGGRFRARVAFRDHAGHAGEGHPVPATAESGRFWFFDAANIELVLKVLDGRGTNGHWWVLWGGLSDVEYDITVTDLTAGKVRTYHNASGNFCGGADTSAF